MNFGIPGDHIEHVLWRIIDITLPDTLKYVIVHSGTNNLSKNSPKDIADGILASGYKLLEKKPDLKVILSGILPRSHIGSSIREKIGIINQTLFDSCCNNNSLFYLSHGNDWLEPNGELNTNLYYSDKLHLAKEGNLRLAKNFKKSISVIDKTSAIQGNTSLKYSECLSKELISRDEDFPPLTVTKLTSKTSLSKKKDTMYHTSMLYSNRYIENVHSNIHRKCKETSSQTIKTIT